MITETDSNKLVDISYRDWWATPQPEVEEFQLKVLQKRFNELRDQIVTLNKLCEIQGVDEIKSLDDVIPILFQHTAYKS